MTTETLTTTELELRDRLREAEQTLAAIRGHDIDAAIADGSNAQKSATLEGADRPYRVLVEQMQEGAITLGRGGTILYCNQHFAAMVQRRADLIIGTRIYDFLAEDGSASLRQLLEASTGGEASGEFALRAAAGSEIPVKVSITELRGESARPSVACGVITDLTHSHRRNDELRATNERLANEIAERTRAEGGLQLALDAAGMGSWELLLTTESIHRSLRHDEIFGYEALQPTWDLNRTLDQVLTDASLPPDAIDRVFLTGGTSFVPAVRDLFERRFGPTRVRSGNEFTSVARGLALRAAEALTQ